MPSEFIRTKLESGVFTITLNRPKVNAFNLEMISALQEAVRAAGRQEEARCVLINAEGRAFSAGQDLNDFNQESEVPFRYHLLRTYNPLVLAIRQLEKPVLAAIQGAASGAGLGVALACDLRIAAEDARFVVGFLGIGLAPDSAVSLLLPALIGLGRAAQFTFSNNAIFAMQALEWGLVNRLTPADQLQTEAHAWAAELAQGPIQAMGLAKRAFNKAVLPNLEQVLDYEAHLQEIAGRRPEHQEGVQAFLEKRPPNFVLA